MEVYLIRHTSPKVEKGICYGQTDIPLLENFTQEAEKVIKNLPDQFDTIFTSPSSRCKELAKMLSGKELILDNRLMEMNFGDWEMKKWNDIDQSILNAWMADFVNIKATNGESIVELNNRVSEFMEELSAKDYKRVAIVSHAGVIRSILVGITEMPLSNAFKLTFDYGSVSKININRENCYKNVEFINKVN